MPQAKNLIVAAVIVAGGSGARFGADRAVNDQPGSDRPKQYLDLGGKAVLAYSLALFTRHPAISHIQVVIDPKDQGHYQAAAQGFDLPPAVPGGKTRQLSVRNGLEALAHIAPDLVLIHDAARPFATPLLLDDLIAALKDTPRGAIGAAPAMGLVDSLVRGTNGTLDAAVSRDGLYAVQTPQAFHFSAILEAHRHAPDDQASDDAGLAHRAGLAVTLVRGVADNIKITSGADWLRAEQILANSSLRETRSGQGFDVHRLVPGESITLCGVTWPNAQKLHGHSDADVALHALTDALLGTVGEGDIGSHFPPSEAKWKGAASDIFVAEALRLITARGGQVIHVDITLICEAPKIGPQRAAMRKRVAEILGLEETRVSVKATTTEQLGFTGRGEGIAAQALATISLPAGD